MPYDQRFAPQYITRIVSEISLANQPVVERYISAKRAAGLKLATCQGAANALRALDRNVRGKSLLTLTVDDLTAHLRTYAEGKMPESIRTNAATIKAFYAWVHDGEAPREIRRALRYKPSESPERIPVTPAEFHKMLVAANETRADSDRLKNLALLWTYWDSGMRSGEVLALTKSSVRFHDDGSAELALPDVEGLKTGPRTIPVYECVGALRAWLAAHPSKNKHAPLFRENTLQDVITNLEPDLFLAVTGLTVKDFHLLVRLKVFNTEQMNQAVFAFRRYEDASLRYTGIESHEGLTHYGLYDTVVARE